MHEANPSEPASPTVPGPGSDDVISRDEIHSAWPPPTMFSTGAIVQDDLSVYLKTPIVTSDDVQ
ncbi:hypothetical protein R3P38DRAFT_3195069 [Favolaschia claudopus]|uniref:Uncharacterized protein n=1 Tax=Favolaschia claudopus TaxID=2862362 RepID=A0AAW0BAI5_9AGAR